MQGVERQSPEPPLQRAAACIEAVRKRGQLHLVLGLVQLLRDDELRNVHLIQKDFNFNIKCMRLFCMCMHPCCMCMHAYKFVCVRNLILQQRRNSILYIVFGLVGVSLHENCRQALVNHSPYQPAVVAPHLYMYICECVCIHIHTCTYPYTRAQAPTHTAPFQYPYNPFCQTFPNLSSTAQHTYMCRNVCVRGGVCTRAYMSIIQ